MQTVDTEAVAAVLAEQLDGRRPRVLLTLGSGLGSVADGLEEPLVIANERVGLPDPTVPGHAGRLIAGRIDGVEVLVQQGRVHLYEGAGVATVTACVDAAAALGIEVFVVTNAAGGLDQSFAAGDLMLIADQLNLTGHSPLVGLARPHFLDMKDCYDPKLRAAARAAADRLGHRIVEGVYAGLVGPAYETPAEVRMLATLGADAVGMSTVSEVIAARAAGMRVLGFSLVTNVHRPGGTPTAHEEVLEASAAAGPRLADIVRAVVADLGP